MTYKTHPLKYRIWTPDGIQNVSGHAIDFPGARICVRYVSKLDSWYMDDYNTGFRIGWAHFSKQDAVEKGLAYLLQKIESGQYKLARESALRRVATDRREAGP